MRAELLPEGRLAEALPVRPLALPEEGRLPTVGRLLAEGRLTLPLVLGRPELLPAVGRLELLPLTLALPLPALAVPDMLPPVEGLTRPSFRLWLMEPAVPLLCLTLAT